MTKQEFEGYIHEVERMYNKQLNETEMKIWYDNLKFMTVERFNLILSELYKMSKFMPTLADILTVHKSLPYKPTQTKENKKHCNKCNDTGYIIYTKVINNKKYNYSCICDCNKQQRYDGKQVQDIKGQSNYYIPTLEETGLEIKQNKPKKQEVISSMVKIKDSGILSENIKELIRQELRKGE